VWLSPGRAIAFLVVNQPLFGLYIGAIFAPNHKGMPLERPDGNWDWMTRQVRTSRNVRTSVMADFLFGVVNLQIEHHLFPGMAHPHLRRAAAITRRYCHERDIPYHKTSALASYAEVLRHFHRTSQAHQAAAGMPLGAG
jgi:fatty acid desaturase